MEEILQPILQIVAKRDFRDRRLDQHFERHDVDALSAPLPPSDSRVAAA